MGQRTVERIRVRYGETDMMGHAYYGNYMLYFEQARAAWCRERGFSYLEMEQSGFKLPVVEVWAKYRGEVKYDDVIAVAIWVGEVRRAAIQFLYEITNESTGKVVTEGYTWQVCVDQSMKAATIPPFFRELVEKGAS
ncbi:MAG: acyl-CoA thioesterase [Armatimonadetes bacterium]|nr:acyl-CoA thioesterase [Armatimonadota bacterium]MBS1710905.1 acyl-CoA thioesterase [Armatimonadota bacterium]MBX3108577.1 acyl-CoA thioesterase [Fimbriimonadaceae bacterium]